MQFHVSRLPRWLRDFVPLLFWLALIFWFSSQSTLIDIASDSNEKLVYKTAHVTVYALLAWLWWRALAARRQTNWSVLLVAWLCAVLYGISDEIHQLFVPGRHGQVADVLFDASGALAMIFLIRRVIWLRAFPAITLFSSTANRNYSAKLK